MYYVLYLGTIFKKKLNFGCRKKLDSEQIRCKWPNITVGRIQYSSWN